MLSTLYNNTTTTITKVVTSTPHYQRVIYNSESVKDKLTAVYGTLNPKLLLTEVDEMIIKIFKIQSASHKDLGNTLP